MTTRLGVPDLRYRCGKCFNCLKKCSGGCFHEETEELLNLSESAAFKVLRHSYLFGAEYINVQNVTLNQN